MVSPNLLPASPCLWSLWTIICSVPYKVKYFFIILMLYVSFKKYSPILNSYFPIFSPKIMFYGFCLIKVHFFFIYYQGSLFLYMEKYIFLYLFKQIFWNVHLFHISWQWNLYHKKTFHWSVDPNLCSIFCSIIFLIFTKICNYFNEYDFIIFFKSDKAQSSTYLCSFKLSIWLVWVFDFIIIKTCLWQNNPK